VFDDLYQTSANRRDRNLGKIKSKIPHPRKILECLNNDVKMYEEEKFKIIMNVADHGS
jgi:hypothetical protein